MRTKSLLLTFVAVIICLSSFAQDKIIKKNGEVIAARISVINLNYIVFKQFDNLDGPEYTIPKGDVVRIKYANGSEDVFEDDNDAIGLKRSEVKAKDVKVLHNIVALAPIAITENGVGVGASYERTLDPKGIVNFYMPVFATFRRNTDTYSGNTETYPMFYAMPGIKVYTNLNGRSKAKFSIGPALVIGAGTGNISDENSSYINGNYLNGTVNRFLVGGMGNIGFSLFPATRLYMGIEYGLGFCYINNYGGINEGNSALTQLSLKIGYRY